MHYLITGGAGFIGSNYAHRLLQRGERVTVVDNLSRRGASANLEWLRVAAARAAGAGFRFVRGDIRDVDTIARVAIDADVIVHLAGQVAVTTSVQDPREDIEINMMGTFNVLEAARHAPSRPAVLYASTNKVYGSMEGLIVEEQATRYAYRDYVYGIPESYPIDFHSPYGCSKGAGDQYVRDYARIYGMKTVVFRQSCIYGPRQFGVEDQGWVAWFVIAALRGDQITIYGNGKQVRDILYVEDLLDAYDAAVQRIDAATGQIYNVGGGPGNQMAIWAEFGPRLEALIGHAIPVDRGDWRPGDQRIFVADIRKAAQDLGWRPKVDVATGIARLYHWVADHLDLLRSYV
ncbi:MAG: SDR family NAD(P)-dependent oxidoreductase [Anaerolineae bacterium]|nr:SDR family NAD(P)-dependent oxidoreductase [Anaerolineae bacterium]